MTSKSGPSSRCPDGTVEAVYRAEWGRLLSLLVSRTRRLDLAEDALSEAFASAAQRWPVQGCPGNPAGWLYTAAHRNVLGQLRSEAVAGRKAPLLAARPEWMHTHGAAEELGDDRLELILLCCHPALSVDGRAALALRLVVGTPTEQIARLFLVPVATMAARLTRAKKKIADAGIPLASPQRTELARRLDDVCATVYLAFTAGYAPGEGADLLRADLAGEAVHLASVLHTLTPDAPQVQALFALLRLQHARRDARQAHGVLVTLADQDRSAWHHDEIRAGLDLLATIPPSGGYAEELRLQALVAAEHARAKNATDTDWRTISVVYEHLEDLTGSAIVRLNRAVAVAEVQGPRIGLDLLAGMDDHLPENHRLYAVRADLAQRCGEFEEARVAYDRAIALCANEVELAHLRTRRRSLADR
jgi:RNA polymerase sigma-70 factor (ECF subfamily)